MNFNPELASVHLGNLFRRDRPVQRLETQDCGLNSVVRGVGNMPWGAICVLASIVSSCRLPGPKVPNLRAYHRGENRGASCSLHPYKAGPKATSYRPRPQSGVVAAGPAEPLPCSENSHSERTSFLAGRKSWAGTPGAPPQPAHHRSPDWFRLAAPPPRCCGWGGSLGERPAE